ncbi:MAG: hypothetical protein F9K32_07080 [Desulfobulbaceae bacterium]|nr:MAG: hypothetical protein F9K32_07080 [Desulfobulbaceae bacterium]
MPTRLASNRYLSKRDAAMVLAGLAFLLVGWWLPQRISVSTSPSLNHRVFFLSPMSDTNRITTGDYLVFRHKDLLQREKGLNKENDRFIKMVGCIPGKRLATFAGSFSCEGVFLGMALTKDGKGKALPQFSFNGTLPPGKYFMIGQHLRSYDSRYFGFIDGHDILYKALPLW